MKRTHIKLMSERDIEFFKEKYSIFLENDKIYVKINRYENKKTAHAIDKSFVINIVGVRIIRFTKDAIDLWIKFLKDGLSFELIDVQEKVNEVYLMYQDINEENVLKALTIKEIKRV